MNKTYKATVHYLPNTKHTDRQMLQVDNIKQVVVAQGPGVDPHRAEKECEYCT